MALNLMYVMRNIQVSTGFVAKLFLSSLKKRNFLKQSIDFFWI